MAWVVVTDTVGGVPDGRAPPRSLETPARAFSADSWWNTPLPDDAPLNPAADEILDYLRSGPESGRGCLTLAGAGDNYWGQPVYDARPGDPSYDIAGPHPAPGGAAEAAHPARRPGGGEQRSQHEHLRPAEGVRRRAHRRRVRRGARLVVGRRVRPSRTWTPTASTWRRVGPTTPATAGPTAATTGPRWRSSSTRSAPAPYGTCSRRLPVPRWPTASSSRWSGPTVTTTARTRAYRRRGCGSGSDPSVDLAALGLQPEALVIARALQTYGFYIGDSGGTTALKLQNTLGGGPGPASGA